MKRIAVKKAASNEMPKDVEIEAGTTAYDLLRSLDLDPSEYSVGLSDGGILEGTDSLYSKVKEGDKVLITEQATVGGHRAAC